jgi:hypothetical protein
MKNFKKAYKKLCNAYNKRLLEIHKESFENFDSPLNYFATYLKFLRDKTLLESPLTETLGEENIKLVSLVSALRELELYDSCIEKFYTTNGNTITHLEKYTAQEAAEKFQKERQQHWEAFWNLTKLCIEDWGINAEL